MSIEEHTIDKHWHLKKELNVGHILTTVLLVVGIITWGNSVDKRVTAAETRIESLDTMMVTYSTDNRALRQEIVAELRQLRRDINILYQQSQQVQNNRSIPSE